jgi:hypothetical protein
MDFMNPLGHFLNIRATLIHQTLPPGVFSLPLRKFPLPEKVFIVQSEFFQTGPGDVCQL